MLLFIPRLEPRLLWSTLLLTGRYPPGRKAAVPVPFAAAVHVKGAVVPKSCEVTAVLAAGTPSSLP
jgi:hypothetical protein